MKKILAVCACIAVLSSLVGCTNRQMGTVGGAGIGGLAGYGLTGGSPVGAAVGVVGGGLIGNAYSR